MLVMTIQMIHNFCKCIRPNTLHSNNIMPHMLFSISFQVNTWEMFTSFRQIGEILDIKQEWHPPPSRQKYLIEYVNITDARFDGAAGEITLDGMTFKFRAINMDQLQASSWVMTRLQEKKGRIKAWLNDKLMVAPTADSPVDILNALNDVCLLQIFSELDAYDLYNVAKTCKRFNGIAKLAFESKYRQPNRSFMDDLRDERLEWRKLSLIEIESFLRTFASEIHAVDIKKDCNSDPNPEVVLRMLNAYCPKIESLNFRGL